PVFRWELQIRCRAERNRHDDENRKHQKEQDGRRNYPNKFGDGCLIDHMRDPLRGPVERPNDRDARWPMIFPKTSKAIVNTRSRIPNVDANPQFRETWPCRSMSVAMV